MNIQSGLQSRLHFVCLHFFNILKMNRINPSITQLIKQYSNPVFTRNSTSKAFTANRQSKTISKLLAGKTKSRKGMWKSYDEGPKVPSLTSLINPISQGKSSLRRVNVLNKLFMRHITDYMATDDTFAGYGLEVSHIKITTDFQLVNVYWLARGDGSDEELESVLSKSTGMLRHSLSQLRLMGEVPAIKFVKDKTYAKGVEVENLLKIADFGDDYVPSNASQMVQTDLSCNTIQPDNVYPKMTHNILGLNQSEIMNRIKLNMAKTKQAWEKYETNLTTDMEREYPFEGEERKAAIIRLKAEEFETFLKQRKSKKFRERKTRTAMDSDDFEEDDEDQFEESDTFGDDFKNDR